MPPAPPQTPDWLHLGNEELPVAEALAWAQDPGCGGTVLFSGTVRDHAEGRPGVVRLEYEAYEEGVLRAFGALAGEARRRWRDLGKIAILHRSGALRVGEAAVVVVASAPHRAEAFAAARFLIDELKASAPIWKHETWAEGSGWSECAEPLVPAAPAPRGVA